MAIEGLPYIITGAPVQAFGGAQSYLEDARNMADLDSVYSDRLLELAASMPRTERLDHPDATASARAKLCGSAITVDIKVADGRFTDFGQDVQACLLGQAAASIVARDIVGASVMELHDTATAMRRMLTSNGPPPAGRWADLALLQPVKDYPHRHASTMLVFDAVEKALAGLEAAGAGDHSVATP